MHEQVKDIMPIEVNERTKFKIFTGSAAHANETEYDAVFFAAPWHLSPISKSISSHFEEQIPSACPLCCLKNEADLQKTTLRPFTRYLPSYDPPIPQSWFLQPAAGCQSPQYDPYFFILYRPRFSIDNMAWRDISRFR